jgi:hypothetical protein
VSQSSKVVKPFGGYTRVKTAEFRIKPTRLSLLTNFEPLPDGEACLEGRWEAVKAR